LLQFHLLAVVLAGAHAGAAISDTEHAFALELHPCTNQQPIQQSVWKHC